MAENTAFISSGDWTRATGLRPVRVSSAGIFFGAWKAKALRLAVCHASHARLWCSVSAARLLAEMAIP